MATYSGKRVVVAGCSSGIGLATVRGLIEQGAEVHGAGANRPDVELASFTLLDLRDETSIEEAVASIDAPMDAVFTCSGLPHPFPVLDIMKVNFIGVRYWTRLWADRMEAGSAIATVTSSVAAGWSQRLETSLDLVATPDFAAAVDWCAAHPENVADAYRFSKEVANVWTMHESVDLIRRGIRLNALCPGPVDTPMMQHFESAAAAAVIDIFAQPIGRRSVPDDQAPLLLFLNSDAARMVVGHLLYADGGFTPMVAVGRIDPMDEIARVTTDS